MNILETIMAHKAAEVAERKSLFPEKLLERSLYFNSPVVSLREYLLRPDKVGLIAEFKRQSPSKGPINPYAEVEAISIGYMMAGASALSVLTDTQFFRGKNEDLTEARKFNYCPVLRKDFILDEYQLIEARSIGADAVLLIAECLEKERVLALAKFAKELGLEVLLEIHSVAQLDKLNEYVDVLGVNNRNLEDFSVSVETSLSLLPQLPQELVRISESGIGDAETAARLRLAGFQGFLIGELFMRESEPAKACERFVRDLGIALEGMGGKP